MFMNRYSYKEDHGIAFHSDYSSAYDERDPITSLSMVNGSFLLVSAKQKPKPKGKPRWTLVIYQPPNSMLIMGGKFQSQFVHGVPSYADMKQLVACGEGDEIPWSKEEQKLQNLLV